MTAAGTALARYLDGLSHATPAQLRTMARTHDRVSRAEGREPANSECWSVGILHGVNDAQDAAGRQAWAHVELRRPSESHRVLACRAAGDAARALVVVDHLDGWALEALTRPARLAGLLTHPRIDAALVERAHQHAAVVHAYADAVGAPAGRPARPARPGPDTWDRRDTWEHEADVLVMTPGLTTHVLALRLGRSPGAIASRRRRLLAMYGRR